MFRQKGDERLTELANITVDLPKPLAPAATAQVSFTYALELKESTALASITASEALLLPESFWVPLVHTPFATYGPDYAPVRLTATADGLRVVGDGRRVDGSYEQGYASQTLLIAGNYDEPFEIKAAGVTCEFLLPRGIRSGASKQAEAVAAEIGKIAGFYTKLGFKVAENVRVVSSSKVGSQMTPTTLVLNEDLFRRDELDVETIEFLARALLRLQIGGASLPRARGWYILQDAIPAYLAGLYFEDAYGSDAGREFFARRARAYAPIAAARTDGPLLFLSLLASQYASSMLNKGSLVFRLLERQAGREKALEIYRRVLSAKTVRYEDVKSAFLELDKGFASFFEQWFDKVSEPDFIIGVPFEAEGQWKCALRNFGLGDALVDVLAIDEKGNRLIERVLLPSQGRSEVAFKSASRIVAVEVDPDKLYPQTNYDNDTRPQVQSAYTLFNEANLNFTKKEYAEAEKRLREAISREPRNTVLRALLLRVLAATSRYDEALREVAEVRKLAPLPIYTITWVNYVLGEVAMAANRPNEAADRFFAAVAASRDTVPARQRLIEAERQAGRSNTGDESVKGFVQQFDRAIKEATVQALEPLINRTSLLKFARGIAANKPENWSTQIVRVEQVTADKLYVDAVITVTSFDKRQQSGSGLLVLRRRGTGWILDEVNLFSIQ
ncbi:MAG: tetratricopeptide repeat protein [Candidatus Bathyarchaeia archaeon]